MPYFINSMIISMGFVSVLNVLLGIYTLLYIKIYLRKFYYELSRDAVNESFDSFGGYN